MSKLDRTPSGRAVALRYDGGDGAPVVVASGMGHLAEKIVEVASESGVPVYEDNSLATMLSQLALGQEIPDSLYRAIVEIYVYFLKFDPNDPERSRREREAIDKQPAPAPRAERTDSRSGPAAATTNSPARLLIRSVTRAEFSFLEDSPVMITAPVCTCSGNIPAFLYSSRISPATWSTSMWELSFKGV